MGLISGKNRWVDPAIHAVAAIGFVGLGAAMDAEWQTAVIQSIFWFSREIEQDVAKKLRAGEKPWPVWPIRYSSQKWIEFLVPVVVGFVIALYISLDL